MTTIMTTIMVGRTHNYTQHLQGTHYVIEPIADDPQNQRFCMTGTGQGIRSQDYILLTEAAGCVRYRVEEINYYCDTPDFWIAQLVRC
ncbi:MAG: hypothetical protein IGS50_08190 [Synechococcales cyanobacterium C42_A2020_086]|jgi:hypothetical protein|nr:hypothetical protein [Synechococcales cyanobacterium C42_A2020_086]